MAVLNDALDIKIDEVSASRVYLGANPVWPSSSEPVPYSPAELFAQGQQGLWYEPKPEFLFQDAGGTVPVVADGDPVGLMLDRSRDLALGPNLMETFDLTTFDLPFRVQDFTADSFTVADGSTDGGVIGRQGEFGKRYTATIHYTRLAPGDITLVVGSPAPADGVRVPMEESGSLTLTRNATAADNTTLIIALYGEGASVRIDSIELREVLGNHARQDTSARRPVYRTDGTRHWLEFDGADDWLNLGGEAVSLFRSADYGLLATAHEASRLSTQVLFSWSINNGSSARIQTMGDNEVARFAGRRLDSDSYLARQLSQVITGPRAQVVEAMWAYGEYRITTNNLASQEGAFHTPGSTSDSDSFMATLGRQATTGSSTFNYQGKLFGVVAAREDPGEVEPLMSYLADLAGVGV